MAGYELIMHNISTFLLASHICMNRFLLAKQFSQRFLQLHRNMTDVSKYRFNHTMYRVRDGKTSLDFYTNVLGMKLIDSHHNDGAKFSLYFLGYEHTVEPGTTRYKREGLLELTHNHGTESDPNFAGYNTGNGDAGGYGHIAVIVDDLQAAVARMDQLGVKFMKRPEDGMMRNIAFILDPDGYRVELIGQ